MSDIVEELQAGSPEDRLLCSAYEAAQALSRLGNRLGKCENSRADMEAELTRLRAELSRCHNRLEIDYVHVYRDDGQLAAQEVPYEERQSIPDAVLCRDEAIKLLDSDVSRLRAELAEARNAVLMQDAALQLARADRDAFKAEAERLRASARKAQEGRG